MQKCSPSHPRNIDIIGDRKQVESADKNIVLLGAANTKLIRFVHVVLRVVLGRYTGNFGCFYKVVPTLLLSKVNRVLFRSERQSSTLHIVS